MLKFKKALPCLMLFSLMANAQTKKTNKTKTKTAIQKSGEIEKEMREEVKSAKRRGLVDQVSGQGYGTAGCGLGSIVFGEKEGMVQIFAVTTNGLWGNQTFAITSGTSNCADAAAHAAAELYIDVNRVAIARDLSRGNGETIEGLANIFGCSNAADLGGLLKNHFDVIFPSLDVRAHEASKTIIKTIHSQKALSKSCKNLG